ncbi:MAG: glycoside hydrolase [Bacteroidota bacterium]|nr:glycoside hydrolase [Bacteroidota bacterium]
MNKKYFFSVLLICILQTSFAQSKWTVANNEIKPWTRWWWMGSAVDEAGIQKQLMQLSSAGFGGVEIVPIYGAIGFENRYIKYLSPQWMKMLDYTVSQAKALKMGVYISVGTGWPIGGSDVAIDDAATKLISQKYFLKAKEKLDVKIVVNDAKHNRYSSLAALMMFKKNGEAIDITNKVDADGNLNFASNEDAELIAAFVGKTLQKVKRAAPGGEGYTIDHFSKTATADYFKIFDTAFGNSSHGVKAFFNDSYEVYGADWTPDFFSQFQKRRGYDLKKYLNIFVSDTSSDTAARLKSDYRETISDLMLQNFSTVFTTWTNKRNTQSVNQAHGSPGNLLDLYGAFDIPECETFGSSTFAVKGLRRDSADVRNVEPDPVMLKFASSAAHAYGKKLTSCETFTWLGEHFKVSWSQCKPEVDQVFLSGINNVFYHGTTYTPADVKFPGWLFYASVGFVPYNSLWPDLKGLNEYIKNCQSVLQRGEPDNELLIYWPIYDVWNNAKELDMPLQVGTIDKWLHPTEFYKNVKQLQAIGYSMDFASDKMLSKTIIKNGQISVSDIGAKHKVLIVPSCDKISVKTFKNILRVAHNGATVIIQSLPKDVKGFFDLDDERKEFINSIPKFLQNKSGESLSINNYGEGKIILGDVDAALKKVNILPETIASKGLQFIKRKQGNEEYYFIVNNTANDFDGDVILNATANHISFTNPLNNQTGNVNFKKLNNQSQFRLQLKSGQSILINFTNAAAASKWNYTNEAGKEIDLQNNKWQLHFTTGGPYLPADKEMDIIQPWTNFTEDSTTQFFSGTGVYTTTFRIKNKALDYLLQLNKLYESARIIVNGKDAGLIWSLPFETKIGKYLREGKNTISIEVCNLMANRMRYMDQHKIAWRKYHEINFVNINYKNFDASDWKVQPSGIDGFVKLIPLTK